MKETKGSSKAGCHAEIQIKSGGNDNTGNWDLTVWKKVALQFMKLRRTAVKDNVHEERKYWTLVNQPRSGHTHTNRIRTCHFLLMFKKGLLSTYTNGQFPKSCWFYLTYIWHRACRKHSLKQAATGCLTCVTALWLTAAHCGDSCQKTLFIVFSWCSSLSVKPSPESVITAASALISTLISCLRHFPQLLPLGLFSPSGSHSRFPPLILQKEANRLQTSLKAEIELQGPLVRSWLNGWARFTNRWQRSMWLEVFSESKQIPHEGVSASSRRFLRMFHWRFTTLIVQWPALHSA